MIQRQPLVREERYGDAWKARREKRAEAVLKVRETLLCLPSLQEPALQALASRVRLLGQQVVAQLWTLLDQLAEHEAAQAHIHEELEQLAERFPLVPRDERHAWQEAPNADKVDRLRANLAEEARDRTARWLGERAEAEERIAELLMEHQDAMSRLAMASNTPFLPVALDDVLGPLLEPPAVEVHVLDAPEEVSAPERLP